MYLIRMIMVYCIMHAPVNDASSLTVLRKSQFMQIYHQYYRVTDKSLSELLKEFQIINQIFLNMITVQSVIPVEQISDMQHTLTILSFNMQNNRNGLPLTELQPIIYKDYITFQAVLLYVILPIAIVIQVLLFMITKR